MAVVLVVRLVFMVLDTNEVAMNGLRVERKGNEGIDGSCFGDDLEGP